MDHKSFWLGGAPVQCGSHLPSLPNVPREGLVDDRSGVLAAERAAGVVDFESIGHIVTNLDGKIIECDDAGAAILFVKVGDEPLGTWYAMLPLQVRRRLQFEWGRAMAAPPQQAMLFKFHDSLRNRSITVSFTASMIRRSGSRRYIGTLSVDTPTRAPATDLLVSSMSVAKGHLHPPLAGSVVIGECKECFQHTPKPEVIGCIYAEREPVVSKQESENASAMAVKCKLLASIGHEMHQPIYAIQNYTSAARQHLHLGEADKVQEMLAQIDRQVARANDIGARLRQFALRSTHDRKTADIHAVIRSCSDIAMMYAADAKADFSLVFEASQTVVQCDSLQIQQVLLNLIRNATDSLVEGDLSRGKIVARTFNRGNRVVVEVIDTGAGVQNSNIDRIFDHFFTTKQSGLGIGLPFCRSIVDSHGGSLRLRENRPGRVVFELALPLETASG